MEDTETGDHGIANLEIQCNQVERAENNHFPSLGNPSLGGEAIAAIGSDSNPLNEALPSSSNQAPVVSFNAKQTPGSSSEFQTNRLPSTTSTTESTATTAATSDGFHSVASSTMNVSSTIAQATNPMEGDHDPQLVNNQAVLIPASTLDPQQASEKVHATMMETHDSNAAPLGQATSPPQVSTETTITVDENEKKQGIAIEASADKQDAGADQANVTGQQLEQSQEQKDGEKQEAKSRKDDSSVETPPIPLEVSSHVNQEHSEYDEELEFDASDDSSEGQLSSDDEEDYIIDPNDFQMGENEPVIIIGVPSMQDTEPSQ